MLIVFSGRPGAGKSTLARGLAHRLGAVYLRIDTIEEAFLADGGEALVARGAGYRVAYGVAEENLKLGSRVVADCVNPIALTRLAWRSVASRAGVAHVDVLVTCSDPIQHQRRIEARPAATRGSSWAEISSRAFEPADDGTVVIDTAGQSAEQSLAKLEAALRARGAWPTPS